MVVESHKLHVCVCVDGSGKLGINSPVIITQIFLLFYSPYWNGRSWQSYLSHRSVWAKPILNTWGMNLTLNWLWQAKKFLECSDEGKFETQMDPSSCCSEDKRVVLSFRFCGSIPFSWLTWLPMAGELAFTVRWEKRTQGVAEVNGGMKGWNTTLNIDVPLRQIISN